MDREAMSGTAGATADTGSARFKPRSDTHARPRVSVVMPVFNGERYLAEAVQSVLGQSLSDLELLAVDDASEDSSRALLDGFAEEDPRVTVIASRRHLGLAGALNLGCSAAQADYVARLDADDIALPERLARQVAFLDAHPEVAVVGTSVVMIDDSGARGEELRLPTDSAGIRSRLRRKNCMAHPTVMFRRLAVEAVGGYRFDYNVDYDLWLRLSERFDLANLGEPLVLYRMHSGQLSVSRLEEIERSRLAVRAAARARVAGQPDPLAGVEKLTPEVSARLGISERQISRAVEEALGSKAATLAELDGTQAGQAIAEDIRSRGRRASRVFAAELELHRARTCLAATRRVAGIRHVLRALAHDPLHSSRQLTLRLTERISARMSSRS